MRIMEVYGARHTGEFKGLFCFLFIQLKLNGIQSFSDTTYFSKYFHLLSKYIRRTSSVFTLIKGYLNLTAGVFE